MRLVLLGPPGSGKGTQAARLAEALRIPAISTGDIFRKNISEQTELGREAKSYIDAGKLVPTDVTARMVEDRLNQDDAKDGFLLDGFPRTVEQAEILTELLAKRGEKLDGVLNFVVDEDVVIERMLARGRADDTEEVIRNRLHVYENQTAPLLAYYGDFVTHIDAVGTVDEVLVRRDAWEIYERFLTSLHHRSLLASRPDLTEQERNMYTNAVTHVTRELGRRLG